MPDYVRTMTRPMLWLCALLAACSSSARTTSETPAEEPEPAAAREAPPDDEPAADPPRAAAPFDWAPWATILEAYVTDDGGFRYEALRAHEAHRAALSELVAAIAEADVDGWPRDAQLAFFINAYNVLVIHTVLERWPIESVIRSEGFFDGVEYPVAGTERTLNGLENDVIRDAERFGEPRIHFAVNCASAGCPPLADAPYAADTLEAMLERQTRAYVRATTQLDRDDDEVRVSRIFEWFTEDFGGAEGVRAFLAERLPDDDAAFVRDASTEIGHFEYDWALNDRP